MPAKTKRSASKKNATRKSKHCVLAPHECTFHGINDWHKHMFEELGWMILAQNRGRTDKIMTYKTSLQHLKECIEHKIKSVHEKDRKEDLHILLKNVCVLQEHVNKDF